ncbi:signal transduction histidine kinase [Thermosporothrix hazakensis]|uniref:histidine kinase n=1 Tax=Thermosporothrix hazakensis TaxID=644383 RepID=A0A326TZS1_THEHA|nr:hybrid sensor histidine kinase/response regulator [Thermosporothrix hazakensis]PZW22374.1 signal transduction histidine kinase [Thermosporothrix hazakensis]GCE49127.1 hybrid sensor histidine kinase/response regulator [Thermosporothrix hazakensis]
MAQAHILIVDDDTALLQALPQAVHLRMKDVLVETADAALTALELIRNKDYDAIVSDIKMPGMDGLGLLRKIQELRPDTPTLLITGHGDHNLAIQALRGGAYDFIQKPIDRDYFVAALYRAIQTRQLRRQVAEQQRALEEHARSLEKAVQERTRELIAANAAKDEFLSMASHELKTPLSSLKGMTQLLRRKLERAGSSDVIRLVSMENSIRRMELLVNDLLNISFIEMGMFVLHKQPTDINELCRRLVDEYIVGTNPPPVVEVDLPAEKIEMAIDVDRFGQVIINLLSNARKYSSAPIRLSVRVEDEQCIISVSDDGVGIPPEVLPHIFERFYRVPGIEVQRGSSIGLGLGLYISNQIVERHGGRIDVQSTPGKGSVFSVVLPLKVASPVEDSTQVSQPS